MGRTSGFARGCGATPTGTGRGSLRVTRAVPPQREAQTLNENNHRISLSWRRIIHGELSFSSVSGSDDLDSVVSGGEAAAEENAGAPARVHSAPQGPDAEKLQRRSPVLAPIAEQTGGTAGVPAARWEGKFTVVPLLRETCN